MPHSNNPESECASLNLPISKAIGKECFRPQGNRTTKEELKNQKMKDATICAQLAATKEMVEASNHKAPILVD